MAIVKDILGNKVSGTVGEVVLSNLNGQTIMRRRPRINPDNRTPAQLRNQERFRLIHRFSSQFKQVLIPQVWDGLGTADNGYNLFVKTNAPAFGPDGELADAKKILLSVGKLALPEQMQAQRKADHPMSVEVKWVKDPSWGGMSLKDELMVISTAKGKYSDIHPTGIKRLNLGGSFTLPEQVADATHIYLFFESKDQRSYSQSICLEI